MAKFVYPDSYAIQYVIVQITSDGRSLRPKELRAWLQDLLNKNNCYGKATVVVTSIGVKKARMLNRLRKDNAMIAEGN